MALIASEELPVAGLARFRSSKSLGERSSSACCLCGYSQVNIWWSILIFFRSTGLWFSQHVSCAMETTNNVTIISFLRLFHNIFTILFHNIIPYKQFYKCRQLTCIWDFQIMVNLIIYVLHMDLEYFRNIIQNYVFNIRIWIQNFNSLISYFLLFHLVKDFQSYFYTIFGRLFPIFNTTHEPSFRHFFLQQ